MLYNLLNKGTIELPKCLTASLTDTPQLPETESLEAWIAGAGVNAGIAEEYRQQKILLCAVRVTYHF